jgi:hypothetical protein
MKKIIKLEKEIEQDDDWEARQNLFGLFSLLLEIDQRINPEIYKKLAEKQRKERERKNKQ